MFGLRWRHSFPELRTLEDLDRLLASTDAEPVLIYKHSLTCGTSAYALEELTQLASNVLIPIHLVPVQSARPVSDAVAERLGVRHESPQLLLVDHGKVLWNGSHFQVTADRVRDALHGLGVLSR